MRVAGDGGEQKRLLIPIQPEILVLGPAVKPLIDFHGAGIRGALVVDPENRAGTRQTFLPQRQHSSEP